MPMEDISHAPHGEIDYLVDGVFSVDNFQVDT